MDFFKEHEYLGNVPPAQKMGIKVPFKDWAEVLQQTKRDMIDLNEPHETKIIHPLPIVHTYSKPEYHPKPRHRPKRVQRRQGKTPSVAIVVTK